MKFLKRRITIRINPLAIQYFKNMWNETGIPCQNLIDSYLTDCAVKQRKPVTRWNWRSPVRNERTGH